MMVFPVPFNESARLEALVDICVLDSEIEPTFDRAASLARRIMDTPSALVSLVAHGRQWFKARENFPVQETPRSFSLCAYAIMTDAPLVIPDTRAVATFAGHPVVVNSPHIRFYVGAPIVLSSGFRVGSVCAIDYVARDAPPPEAVDALRDLAHMVADMLEMRAVTQAAVVATSRPPPAEAARSEFLSLVSHELRTPLNGVLGFGDILRQRLEGGPERDLIDGIAASAETLRRVVERILHFSDVSTGEIRLHEWQADTRELVDRSVALNTPAAKLRRKRLEVMEPIRPSSMIVDAAQLEVALACLIANAVAHGGENIEVSADLAADDEIELIVEDDGPGVRPDKLDRIFEPFEIGEDVLVRRGEGAGLGLPLTRKLVELHAGELSLDRSGDRTRARIRLPAWRNVAA